MKEEHKNWILMTGASRGIGRSIAENLRKRGFRVCGMLRHTHLNTPHLDLDKIFAWDLNLSWESNAFDPIRDFLSQNRVIGFIHAAGVLGPMNPVPGAENAQEWKAWWKEYDSTFRVNHFAALEILFAIKNQLSLWRTPQGLRQPFIMHLSSGAATKPYAGWDAYCASKASMLMAFKTLSAKISADELNVLSVAPGTVMTDMMQKVLLARPEDFPALPKFKILEQTGGLVAPEESARQVCGWLIDSTSEELKNWHGQLYDVRERSSAMK